MQRVTVPLAGLLSVLIALTSASASVCNLSCWLAQTSSGCESAMSQMDMDKGGMDMGSAMNMSPGMDMSPSDNGVPDSRQPANHPSRHAMPAQMGMPREPFRQAVVRELNSSTKPDHGQTAPPCVHESCRQFSTASSPPNMDQSPPASLHSIAICVSCPSDPQIAPHQIVSGAAPHPATLAIEQTVVPLRI
jgi:hypothetical protein